MSDTVRRKGAMFALLLTVFIDMVGFGIIIPFMPFWAEHYDATPDMVTLLFATYSAVAFVFSFLWGWASDQWGRKPVLLLSLLGSVMSFLWLGFADALWMLFAARALGGVFGANITVAQAYVADVTELEDRARGMGMMGAAFGMGFVIGPAIGGLLAGPDAANPDFRTPFLVAAGVSLVGVLVGAIFLREPDRHRPPETSRNLIQRLRSFTLVIAHPGVAMPVLVLVIMGFAMAGLESTLALWTERAHGWGPRETGYFFGFIGIMLVIVQGGIVGKAVRRFGEARVAPFGAFAMMIGIGMIPWCSTAWLVLVSGAMIVLGYGLGNPSLNGLISRSAPDHIQGAVLGASQSAQALCRVFGPITAGALFAAFGPDMPYYVGGAILAVAGLAALRLTQPGGS
jgi:DHA1 family tetracycline resistance protein-like MFS transporter